MRLLLSWNQRIEVRMFQEAVGGVEIQLLLLQQIPLRIPSSTNLPSVVELKQAYCKTIPKMWICGLWWVLCQILSSWEVFLWNLWGPSFQFGKLCKLGSKCSLQIMVCHNQSSTFCLMSHQSIDKKIINYMYVKKILKKFRGSDLIKTRWYHDDLIWTKM